MRSSFSLRKTSRLPTSKSNSFSTYLEHLDEDKASFLERIRNFDYRAFKNFVLHVKYSTVYGLIWDVVLVLLSLLACATYVMETYWASYHALKTYSLIEDVITQFFLVDFIIGWIASHSTRVYLTKLSSWIDVATIAPVYVSYIFNRNDGSPNLSILRFLRILRLIRILKTFRLVGGMSGVKRQSVTLSLAITSIIFLSAGIIHIFENELQQNKYDCQYINEMTSYEPSCDPYRPTYNSTDCDCQENNCKAYYEADDKYLEPSSIKCQTLQFFDSLFFTIITIYPVGYGSMIVTDASRCAIIVLIIASLVVIPIQVNKLSLLIAMNSQYRRPFKALPYESHVLVCGFCNDKEKLSRILREFFNPDRISLKTPLYHMVVMTPQEPYEDVVDLINSPLFESRVTYLIGSALDEKDLMKARADVASAIFFISDSQADNDSSTCEDAATVLRTLSIINFNPDMECFVEVLNEHDRRTLEDCQADVVVCLDDYKFTLQARNAICMGLGTMCENLFNSFSTDGYDAKPANDWLTEYTYGLGMEFYYLNIDQDFFAKLRYNWSLLVECVFLEFECLLIGVCRPSDYSVHLNPRNFDRKFTSLPQYYQEYCVGVCIAQDYSVVMGIQYALSDMKFMESTLAKLYEAEVNFRTRVAATIFELPVKIRTTSGETSSHEHHSKNSDQQLFHILRIQKDFDDIYSLKNCYQRKSFKKKPVKQNFGMKPSNISQDGNDSDSSSSSEGDDEFLGYIEEDSDSQSDSRETASVVPFAPPKMRAPVAAESSENESSPLDLNLIAKQKEEEEEKEELSDTPTELGAALKLKKKKRTSLDMFGNAARTVTKMLKPDPWDEVVSYARSVNLHGEAEGSEPLHFLDYPQITPLQREIMRVKSKRTAGTAKRGLRKPIVKMTSQIDGQLTSPGKYGDEDAEDNKSVRKGSLNNLSDTLRKFQMKKQKSAKLNSDRIAAGRRSLQRIKSVKDIKDQTPKKERAHLSTDERKRRFQGRGSRSIEEAKASGEVSAKALRSLRKSKSVHLRSFESQYCAGETSVDVGEIMGVTSKYSRSMSKSNSIKEISLTSSNRGVLRANSFEDKSTSRRDDDTRQAPLELDCQPSVEVGNAKKLSRHVIVIGSFDYLTKFVKALRKKNLLSRENYHPILIVAQEEPADWGYIKETYKDVHFLRRGTQTEQDLLYMNIRHASAMVIFGSRRRITLDEATNIDSNVLFHYLAIVRKIPTHVNITVEIFRPSSVGVMNSAINHHQYVSGSAATATPTGISRKGNSMKGIGMKIAGNDSKSFYRYTSGISDGANSSDSDDDENNMDQVRPMKFRQDKVVPMNENARASLSRNQRTAHAAARQGGRNTRRMSVAGMSQLSQDVKSKDKKEKKQDVKSSDNIAVKFWNCKDTHHVMPVFAAGRAFVPTAFDAIFIQSFFSSYSLQVCEKLICGDEFQVVLKLKVPKHFVERKYSDLFRALNVRGVLLLGLYRYPDRRNEAHLPYVFTNPPPNTVLHDGDMVYAFGHPDLIEKSKKVLSLPLKYKRDGAAEMSSDPAIKSSPISE